MGLVLNRLYRIVQDLLILHLLNVMHIEKNVCVSLFKTFSNCKGTKVDSLAIRRCMQDLNIMPQFHPKHDGVDGKGAPDSGHIFLQIGYGQQQSLMRLLRSWEM